MFFCHTPQKMHSDKIASPAEHSLLLSQRAFHSTSKVSDASSLVGHFNPDAQGIWSEPPVSYDRALLSNDPKRTDPITNT